MGVTSSNKTSLSYILESSEGVTPATPTFQKLPVKSNSLAGNITTAVSEAITGNRQIDDLVIVDSEVGGSVGYELSYSPYKPFLQALLQNGDPVVVNHADVDIDITDNADGTFTIEDLNATFVSSGFEVGATIKIAGFSNAGNNRFAKVTALTETTITCDDGGVVAITEAAGQSVTLDQNTLTNGTAVAKSYSFLKNIQGITTPANMYYRGCQVSSMSFDFQTGAILQGEFELVGLTEEVTETPIAGQTYSEVSNYALMNSVSSVASVSLGGLPATTKFQSVNLSINNNINAAKQIGVLGAASLASYTLEVMAEISIYFEDIIAYTTFKNAGSFSVAMHLQDSDGNNLFITMPKCKFESLDSPVEGKDNFLMLSGSFRALRDAGEDATIRFDFHDA